MKKLSLTLAFLGIFLIIFGFTRIEIAFNYVALQLVFASQNNGIYPLLIDIGMFGEEYTTINLFLNGTKLFFAGLFCIVIAYLIALFKEKKITWYDLCKRR